MTHCWGKTGWVGFSRGFFDLVLADNLQHLVPRCRIPFQRLLRHHIAVAIRPEAIPRVAISCDCNMQRYLGLRESLVITVSYIRLDFNTARHA